MKRIGFFAIAIVGVTALPSAYQAEAAGKCTSVQAKCAVQIGGECNADTGSWRYRGGPNMIAMFNDCLSKGLKQQADKTVTAQPKAIARATQPPRIEVAKDEPKKNAADLGSQASPQVPPQAPAPVQSAATELTSDLSCDALSTSPEKNAAFKSKMSLSFRDGVLGGERALRNGRGSEVYHGAINHLGEISLAGQGQRENARKSRWSLTFNGRLNDAGQTVLKGSLINHGDGGKRNCELAIMIPAGFKTKSDVADVAKPPAVADIVTKPPAVAEIKTVAPQPTLSVQAASPEPPPVVRPRPQLDQKATNLKIRLAASIGEEAAARVVDGDPNDILILINEASSAPHAIRVLSGEIKFQQDRADICRTSSKEYGEQLDFYIQREIRKTFPVVVFSNSTVTAKLCESSGKTDVVVVRRAAIDSIESLGFNVADAIGRRQLSVLVVVSIAPYELQRASTLRLQQANAEQLTAGTLAGIGSIAVAAGNQNAVCVSNAEDADFIVRLLAHMRSSTVFESRWPEKPTILAAVPDEIFIDTKRNRCGFIVGDAGLLEQMLKGLRRDAIGKDSNALIVSSVFVPKDEAEKIAAAVAQHRALIAAQAEQDAVDAARKAEAADIAVKRREIEELKRLQLAKTQDATQRALDDIKRKNDEIARIEEIQRQRRVVASRGQTIVDAFGARLRRHISSVTRQVKDLRRRAAIGEVPSAEEVRKLLLQVQDERIDREFPVWAKWLSERAKEEWEFSDPILTLQDYGMSKWKDRPIEAISVKVEFPMLNKLIGDRKKYCVQFVWINDEEFSFYREPKSFECDLYKGAFQGWSIANQFDSRWNASLP